jgi:hypothetical protein
MVLARRRGRKRFRLFAPSHAHRMQTVGTIARVHRNGRICYRGAPTAADGRTAEEVAMEAVLEAKRHQRRAEATLAAAEAAAEEAEEAEEEEAAEEGAAEEAAGLARRDGGGLGAPRAAAASAAKAAAALHVSRSEEALEDAMDNVLAAEAQLRRRRRAARTAAAAAAAAPSGEPPSNFSRLGALEIDGNGRLPAALRGVRVIDCEVRAGEMLFLPAVRRILTRHSPPKPGEMPLPSCREQRACRRGCRSSPVAMWAHLHHPPPPSVPRGRVGFMRCALEAACTARSTTGSTRPMVTASRGPIARLGSGGASGAACCGESKQGVLASRESDESVVP